MIDNNPALIMRCADAGELLAAVGFAWENGVLPAVRGGGHPAPASGAAMTVWSSTCRR
jgi:hypothetical protein